MPIQVDKCKELNWPLPLTVETEINYITRLMASGYKVNSRQTRFVGIGALNSILSTMKIKKKVCFCQEHKLAYCPALKLTPPFKVDHAWMTEEQRIAYWEKKKAH